MEQEETLCDEVETVREFTYLGDSVNTGGGCGWDTFLECSELLHGRRCPLKLELVVYKSYIRPAILYGSAAWSLKKMVTGIL